MRKDVMRYAEKLSGASGIDPDALYAWLMHLGKDRGINPRKIPLAVGLGRVMAKDNPDGDYIERYIPPAPAPSYDGPDYEELILLRQDTQYDD